VYEAESLTVFSHSFVDPSASIKATCTCLGWSAQEPWETLLCGLSDGSVAVWDLAGISLENIPADAHQRLVPPASEMGLMDDGPAKTAAARGIIDLACSSENDNMVVTISRDRMVRVWDIRLPHQPVVEKVIQNSGNLQTVGWPANADYIVIGDDVGHVTFLSLQDGMTRKVRVHRDAVTAAAVNTRLHPTLLASCSVDGIVRSWVLPARVRTDLNDVQALDAISSNDKLIYMCTAAALRPGNAVPSSELTISLVDPTDKEAKPRFAVVASNEDIVVPSRQYRFTPEYVIKNVALLESRLPSEISFSAVAWGASFEPSGEDAVMREWLAMATRAGLVRCKLTNLPRVPIAWPHDRPAPNVPYPQFIVDQYQRVEGVKI